MHPRKVCVSGQNYKPFFDSFSGAISPELWDVIYHIPAKICKFSQNTLLSNLMEKIESAQYSAALAITGAWRGTSRQKLYADLGWESLSSRRWSRRLT